MDYLLDAIIREELNKGKSIAIYPCGNNGMLAKEILEQRYGKTAILIDNYLAKCNTNIVSIDEFLNDNQENVTVIITATDRKVNAALVETVANVDFDVRNIIELIDIYKPEMPKGNIMEHLSKLNHIEEYRCYEEAMEVSDSIYLVDCFESKKIIAHAYWYGELGRKQIFSLKSFLATQDMNKVEVWLWLDEENGYENYESNKLLQSILPFITVKKYNPIQEIKDLFFEQISELFLTNFDLTARADAFRILAMYKYGGFYFDMDMLFLKDMSYLWTNHEFVYAWEKQPFANNAAIYFRKGSFLTEYVAQKAKKEKSFRPWVLFQYSDKQLKSLMIYPDSFFDPLWIGYVEGMPLTDVGDLFLDRDSLACKKVASYRDFFEGSYAFHWHNRWKDEIDDNSYFKLFESEFEDIIKSKFSK